MLSRPEPTGPKRRVCSNVPKPDTNSAMLTRKAPSAAGSFSAREMISGGVTIPTNTAITCCSATKIESLSGGASFNP